MGRKAVYVLDTYEKNDSGHFRETRTRNEFWSENREKRIILDFPLTKYQLKC